MAIVIDKKIIGKAVLNDKEAVSHIVERFRKPVLKYILSFTPSAEDAEDILQETLDKVFRNISSYNPSYALSTWIYTIARNTYLDHFRKKKAEQIDYIPETSVKSPEEKYIHEQEVRDLENAIRSLDTKYSKIAELRFLNDYAYEDIAQLTGLPLNTVKTRIMRAKKLLNQKWNN